MKKYALIIDGYIEALCETEKPNSNLTEITQEVADTIQYKIKDCPPSPNGYVYKLSVSSLEWELVKLPTPSTEEDEITDDEAFSIIMGESA